MIKNGYLDKMKSDKALKLMVHTFSAGIIRPLIIVALIWGVMVNSRQNAPKAMTPEVSTNANLSIETDQTPPPVNGQQVDHLYHKFIVQTASQYQIDPALIKAIIMAESGYNSKAVSKSGAKGLMQLMPETAEALGV